MAHVPLEIAYQRQESRENQATAAACCTVPVASLGREGGAYQTTQKMEQGAVHHVHHRSHHNANRNGSMEVWQRPRAHMDRNNTVEAGRHKQEEGPDQMPE